METNDGIITLFIGLELTEKLSSAGIFDRAKEAELFGEDIKPIVVETEPLVIEVIDEITKPDSELDEEDQALKAKLTLEMVNHQYRFFGLPTPYNEDAFDDEAVKQVEGIRKKHSNDLHKLENVDGVKEEAEEIFLYDSHDEK